jgi:hypothetical protein
VTIYTLPAEPVGPVWLIEPTNPDNVVRYYRVDGPAGPRWRNDAADELAWLELLALGEVTDAYPGGYEFHGTATPWYVDPESPRTVRGADGAELFYVSGEDTVHAEDVALAKLIVELVNRHAAGEDEGVKDQPAEAAAAEQAEQALRDAYALAANELVLNWRIAPVELRVEVGQANGKLVERLDAFVDAHARVR